MSSQIVSRLRAQIAGQMPVDERHATSITRFLDALDTLPAPLDQDADPTHVTASAIVVGHRGTVLHKHKRLRLWMQPGGHIEAGEAPADAVLREVLEETGLAATHPGGSPRMIHVDVHPAGAHVHLDLRYLVEARDDDPSPGPGESPDVRWFGWDEALDVADAALAGALRLVAPG